MIWPSEVFAEVKNSWPFSFLQNSDVTTTFHPLLFHHVSTLRTWLFNKLFRGIWLNNGSHYLITVRTVRCAASTVFAFFMFYFIIFWDVRNVKRETKRGAGFLMFLLRCPWWDSACILATLPQCVHLLECTTVPAQLSSWGVKRSELRQAGSTCAGVAQTDISPPKQTNKKNFFLKTQKKNTCSTMCEHLVIWCHLAMCVMSTSVTSALLFHIPAC